MTTHTSQLERASKWLKNFADAECKDRWPLYEALARGLAEDDETLALAVTDRGQPPHILLAAVHFLLLKGTEHPLGAFYPSLTSTPSPPADVFPTFRGFCTQYREPLRLLVDGNYLQTNEVGRCAYLCLVFGMISESAGKRPLSLIDVGASAGLNLLWDKYTYRFRDVARYGDPSSPVGIQTEFRGEKRPSLPVGIPEIVYRRGIDIHPLDVAKEDDALWLRALVWPEDRQRTATLEKAMAVYREYPVEVVKGSGIDLVSDAIAQAPGNSIVCVFHTHSKYHWPEAENLGFLDVLSASANSADLRLVSAEGNGKDKFELFLTTWKEGKSHSELLAHVDRHGQWIEWLA